MNILVGYDESESACAAVKLAERHAIAWNAKLVIVQTIPQQRELSFLEIERAEKALRYNIRKLLQANNLNIETHLVLAIEAPGAELVKFANENKIDEIVIGIGKKSRLGKLLFGSNAQHVILNSPCPVVTVK